MSTRWTQFLSKHAGKGYTRAELSKMYKKKYQAILKKESKAKELGKSLRRKPRKFSKKVCQSLVRDKVSANMEEYRKGRWVSPKQAVAVSYSQVNKRYPKCKKFLRKTSK